MADIRKWSIDFNITQAAVKGLLGVFKKHIPEHNMPEDPRTLMKTPTKVEITTLNDGSLYWHHGIFTCLQNSFDRLDRDLSIQINLNIDGLPLHRSSMESFWPILFNIHEFPSIPPMAIGIFYGEKKPESAEIYFEQFVEEMEDCLQSGVVINGHLLRVGIRCFICDSPARAFIKATMNFNAKSGCQKCKVVGKFSHISNTVVFKTINDAPRTDEEFRSMKFNDRHQLARTPLVRLPIDTIKDIIVADELHLLHLGVMKRLIMSFMNGVFGNETKWDARNILEISEQMMQFRTPCELGRDARNLALFRHWKGTEFRNFLNYFGAVVLQHHLPRRNYHHFLLLFCAVRVFSAPRYVAKFLHAAKLLIEAFINQYKELYGTQYMTSNVHNLCHIADDVERFGILPSMSAYPFENALGALKRLIRAGKHPLTSVAYRLRERLFAAKENFSPEMLEKKPHSYVIKRREAKKYCEISFEGFKLSNRFQDKWFSTKDNRKMCFENARIIKAEDGTEQYVLDCYEIVRCTNLFTEPMSSSHLDIHLMNISDVTDVTCVISACDVDFKFVCMRADNKETNLNSYVLVAMLHTLK